MFSFIELQKAVYDTTKSLGYTVNKGNTLRKLKEELKEFRHAKRSDSFRSEFLSNIQDDKAFKECFEHHVKHTEHDEIPDMFFVLLSYCQEYDIDFETLVMNKLRYNKLR